jgi:Leucine-rich repeat (LRR) protein
VYGLDLSKQGLISLYSFKQFPKLQTVNLFYNKLSNLAPEGLFDGLKDLKELRITDNSVADLSEIRGGGLIALYADFNLVESVAGLGKLKVREYPETQIAEIRWKPDQTA